MFKVNGLFRSLVKSGAIESLEEVQVDQTGLENNRRFVVTDVDGVFLRQGNEHSRLALVASELGSDGWFVVKDSTPKSRVYHGGNVHNLPDAKEVITTIRESTYRSLDLGEGFASTISKIVGTDCRLHMIQESFDREFGPVLGIDSSPISILSVASMSYLNSRIAGADCPADRFRSSIMIEGCEPHEEDTWRRIRIGEIEIEWRKLAPRCDIPKFDQHTGEKGGVNPLRALSLYRRGSHVGGPKPNKIYFASYYFGPETPGVIRVGDRVEVLESV